MKRKKTKNQQVQIRQAQVVCAGLDDFVPAQQESQYARPRLLLPPDWRFQDAQLYLLKERNHEVPAIPNDPFVQYLIRVMRAYRRPANREYVERCWPDAVQALQLGTIAKHTAITAQLEACLISGFTAQDLRKDRFYIDPTVYEIYRLAFFDLTGIKAVHAWVNDFLFQPQKHSQNQVLLRSRLAAYYGNRKLGVKAAIMGRQDKDVTALLKQLATSERERRIFDYMTKVTSLDTQTYAALMETAVKNMTEQDFQEHMKDRDQAGSSSLQQLAQNLEQGIRAFSQNELSQQNDTGLDFVNKYTATILRKGN